MILTTIVSLIVSEWLVMTRQICRKIHHLLTMKNTRMCNSSKVKLSLNSSLNSIIWILYTGIYNVNVFTCFSQAKQIGTFLNISDCLSSYFLKHCNKDAVSSGDLVTTSPSESQPSCYDQLNHGRQFDSISTSSSLPEAWRSTHTCCVFLQDSYPWGAPLFLCLLSPGK